MKKKCKVCGCSRRRPCEDYKSEPCAWDDIHPDVCTLCVDAAAAVAEWMFATRTPDKRALMRLAKEIFGSTPIPYVLVEK